MKRSNVVTLMVLSFGISGCGAAQLAMKGPISNQCASSGLKGCPDLTEGVMEFVGGDKAVAEKQLRAAAAANSPEKLRVFASALAAMNVSGQFILEDGEELFAGVRTSAAAPKDDVKCAITWSGFRPVSSATR